MGLYILKAKIKAMYPMWSLWPPKDMDFNKYFAIWGVGLHGDIRVGASTLLAILISPLIWALTIYTIFLIYCGTTTNESMKWTDLKEDMRDGYAFRRPLAPNRPQSKQWEPPTPRWPSSPECIIMTTLDGQPPNSEKKYPGEGQWEHVWDLKDVENIYDLGFWHNMGDLFVSNHEPGDEASEPLAERRPRGRSISTKLGHPQ